MQEKLEKFDCSININNNGIEYHPKYVLEMSKIEFLGCTYKILRPLLMRIHFSQISRSFRAYRAGPLWK